MPGRGRNRNNRNRRNQASVEGEVGVSFAGDSPILAVFLKAARQLTCRHDRHERLVKLSRDVTIESKRIIFLLHSAATKEKSQLEIVDEAKERIAILINGPIKAIAMELEPVPAHLHYKAVAAGLQEFVEARTLCSLMENKEIISCQAIQNEFNFKSKSKDGVEQTICTPLPPLDYMLGVADLSGELMRKAINGIASGNTRDCFFDCLVLQKLYAGFLGLYGAGQVVTAKLNTTRANVYKVEQALYAYSVRGREALPHLELAAPPPERKSWEQEGREDDQGCY